jgi:TonB family protein
MFLAVLMATAALVQEADGAGPAERVRDSLASYFSTDDYPAGAIARRAQGTVRFELEVAADGRVSDCRVTGSSGDEDLDTVTCSILIDRVRYRPARDARGRAIGGSDQGSVTWRLPESGGDGTHHPAFEPLQLASTMRRSETGTISCSFAYNGNMTRLDEVDQCASFRGFGAEQALARLGAGAELTLIYTIQPSGAPLAAGVEARGEALFDTRAEISVASDGSVAACRVTQAHLGRPVPGPWRVPDLCAIYAPSGRPAFQPDPRRGEARAGELGFTLHLRIAPGPPR